MQKFRFQYQFDGKGLENNYCPSVKQIRKIKMAVKIQDGCQFPAFCLITLHNFCTIEHKIVILVSIHTFTRKSN